MNSSTYKEIALSFQNLIVVGKVAEAYDKYIHREFCHHNPYFKGDRASLLDAMQDNAKQFPEKVFEVQRVIEEGAFVVVHSRLTLQPAMPEIAMVHIFRFEDDKIIEEWDLGQEVPKHMQNEKGMF